jgi:hypothetical protein
MEDEKDFKLEISPEWRAIQNNQWKRPKWVKLPRSILDDDNWLALSNEARALWITVLLIASERDNYELPDLPILFRRFQAICNLFQTRKIWRLIHELIQGKFLKKSSDRVTEFRVTESQSAYSVSRAASARAAPPEDRLADSGEGKESREEGTGGEAELHSLAREYYGKRGASLVAKALRAGMPETQVREIIADGVAAGAVGDAEFLGQALSSAWQ